MEVKANLNLEGQALRKENSMPLLLQEINKNYAIFAINHSKETENSILKYRQKSKKNIFRK